MVDARYQLPDWLGGHEVHVVMDLAHPYGWVIVESAEHGQAAVPREQLVEIRHDGDQLAGSGARRTVVVVMARLIAAVDRLLAHPAVAGALLLALIVLAGTLGDAR